MPDFSSGAFVPFTAKSLPSRDPSWRSCKKNLPYHPFLSGRWRLDCYQAGILENKERKCFFFFPPQQKSFRSWGAGEVVKKKLFSSSKVFLSFFWLSFKGKEFLDPLLNMDFSWIHEKNRTRWASLLNPWLKQMETPFLGNIFPGYISFGIVIGKKIGKAHQRNKIRRRIQHALRQNVEKICQSSWNSKSPSLAAKKIFMNHLFNHTGQKQHVFSHPFPFIKGLESLEQWEDFFKEERWAHHPTTLPSVQGGNKNSQKTLTNLRLAFCRWSLILVVRDRKILSTSFSEIQKIIFQHLENLKKQSQSFLPFLT